MQANLSPNSSFMKKSYFVNYTGALVLSFAAGFSTKANRVKFNTANTAATTTGVKVIAVGHFTTNSTQGVPCYFRTNIDYTLYTEVTGWTRVYYKYGSSH